jgi:hypothetical protein
VRRAPLDLPCAALVDEGEVRLLRRAAHVGTVARRAGAIAVRGDGRPRVGDVRLVDIDGRVAPSVPGSGTHDHAENQTHSDENERPGTQHG